jgi:hypothetical protein
MKKLLVLVVLLACPALAEDVSALKAVTPRCSPNDGRTMWKTSLAAFAVADAIDIHSSWGKRELNPVLANASGRFSTQGALVKIGLHSGVVGIEYLLTRGHSSSHPARLRRVLAIVNFGAAGATAAIAAHNYTIAR